MAEDIRVFEGATVTLADATTEPMTVTVEVAQRDGGRQGSGEMILPQEVFDKLEEVQGKGTVTTAGGEAFTIMIRQGYRDTRQVEFLTSGPVPEAS